MKALACVLMAGLLWSCTQKKSDVSSTANSLIQPNEKHFANMVQLTREGENSAEAYYSFNGQRLIFQSTREGYPCDQIYTMNLEGSNLRRVSTGKGRTTCSYFLKDDQHIIFSSTHLAADTCPPRPDFSRGYVWAIYPGYDIFEARDDGSEIRPLTTTPGYDAEATISPDGQSMVFTSMRDGDLDIYSMNVDGTNARRLTNNVGYDGGPFFSPDGNMIVYRAYHPTEAEEVEDYQALLGENLIRPSKLEIFVMNADGTEQRQVTNNGAANFAPFFHPDNRRILFCSNMDDPKHRNFDLYMINMDGSGQERLTYHEEFDGFPMFSPDGRKFVFCSNRNAAAPHQTNVFLADWVE